MAHQKIRLVSTSRIFFHCDIIVKKCEEDDFIKWEELIVGDFEEALERSGGLCVIPIGATEKHGPHLPLGTDCIIARHTAQDAAKIEPAVIFEGFNYGQLLGFQHHSGSICLSMQLMIDYLSELCSEIARNGFKKILLLSSHGGNADMLNVITQKTQECKKDYVILSGNCYHRHPKELLSLIEENGQEKFPILTNEDIDIIKSYCSKPMDSGHACFCETLELLGVRPDLANMSKMDTENGENTHRFNNLKNMICIAHIFGRVHIQIIMQAHIIPVRMNALERLCTN